MSLAQPLVTVWQEFGSAFSRPTWRKVQVLIVGPLLARGRRTVTAALRQRGLADASNCSLSHHVLSRARWSALDVRHCFLGLFVRTLVAVGRPLVCVIDETWERRWGRRISRRGHARDPLASSTPLSVATSGVRWLVLPLVVTPPWRHRAWALPGWSVPAPTPEVSQRVGRRHQTGPQRARQMIGRLRRWWPAVELSVLGDQTYSVLERGGACTRRRVRLIAPRRRDAALYAPAPPRVPGTNGRPRVKGECWPQLTQVLQEARTLGPRVEVRWYDGRRRPLAVTSGTAVWSRMSQPVLPVRWGRVRAPTGQLEPRAYFSTCPGARARAIVPACMKRWTIETTCEESRAQRGRETPRPWADRASERTAPCLLGLYSVVALRAHALPPDGKIPLHTTAW